jgi:hypothetical protein
MGDTETAEAVEALFLNAEFVKDWVQDRLCADRSLGVFGLIAIGEVGKVWPGSSQTWNQVNLVLAVQRVNKEFYIEE